MVYRLLERHGWRKVAPDTRHPKAQPSVQDEWKKNASRKFCGPAPTVETVGERPIRLMFQDEARFGAWPASGVVGRRLRCDRLCLTATSGNSRSSRRCQSLPWRIGLEFERHDEHGPNDGVLVASQSGPSPGVHRNGGGRRKLAQGQGVGRAGECAVDRFAGLFAELNPQEHIWDEVREKVFPNLVLDQMAVVIERLKNGLGALAADAGTSPSDHCLALDN